MAAEVPTMPIIAVANNKGGVGKTTTAVNLAAALAARGRRVALIDLDGQRNATVSLGMRDAPPLAGRLLAGAPGVLLTRETGRRGLWLVPGDATLAAQEPRAVLDGAARRDAGVVAIANMGEAFDVVVVDCPPALGAATGAALAAADVWLVPVAPHFLALEGLSAFLRVAQERGGARAGLLVLLTMVDRRILAHRDAVEMIRAHFGARVLAVEIPVNTRLAEAPARGMTAAEYSEQSTGAAAYSTLAAEMETKLGGRDSG